MDTHTIKEKTYLVSLMTRNARKKTEGFGSIFNPRFRRSGGERVTRTKNVFLQKTRENAHINNSNGRWPVYPLSGRTSVCHSTSLLRRRRWLCVRVFFPRVKLFTERRVGRQQK